MSFPHCCGNLQIFFSHECTIFCKHSVKLTFSLKLYCKSIWRKKFAMGEISEGGSWFHEFFLKFINPQVHLQFRIGPYGNFLQKSREMKESVFELQCKKAVFSRNIESVRRQDKNLLLFKEYLVKYLLTCHHGTIWYE